MAIKDRLSKLKQMYREMQTASAQSAVYRVVEVEKDEHGDYTAVIQVSGKNITFKAKPEEILADDEMTMKFSQLDVRTLTYLGYVDLNNPKYRILAKQFSEEVGRTVFAVHKKGEKDYDVKTAAEIATDEELIKSLDQKDAHMVGYTSATEHMMAEKAQMEQLKKLAQGKAKLNPK